MKWFIERICFAKLSLAASLVLLRSCQKQRLIYQKQQQQQQQQHHHHHHHYHHHHHHHFFETLSFEEESINFSTNSIHLLLLFVIEWYHFEVGNFSINFDLRVAIIVKTFAVNKDTSLGFAWIFFCGLVIQQYFFVFHVLPYDQSCPRFGWQPSRSF